METSAQILRYIVLVIIVPFIGCSIPADLAREIPSDAEMKKVFNDKRSDFDTLVRMSNEDSHVNRVAYDFTWVSGQRDDSNQLGFSDARWTEYKSLFDRLQLQKGIVRASDGSVWFFAFSKGLAVSGLSKGYVYSSNPPNCTFLSSLDGQDTKVRRCMKLDENWYLYLSGD